MDKAQRHMTLAQLDKTQWRYLRKATEDAQHPYRNITLATIGADGTPQMRYLILRGADEDTRRLELHTDTRSAKWSEIAANSKISLLAYDAEARVQIRLAGTAHRHPPDDSLNECAWSELSTWARKTYCGGPPGLITDWAEPDKLSSVTPTEDEVAFGRARFGVLTLRIKTLDWFKHPRGDIRRAQLTYTDDGTVATADWVQP